MMFQHSEIDAPTCNAPCLFGITQQCNATHGPVHRVLGSPQLQWEDVVEISSFWLSVHGAHVGGIALLFPATDSKNMDNRKWCVQDLRRGFLQAGVATIPCGTVKEQTVHVDTYNGKDTIVMMLHNC